MRNKLINYAYEHSQCEINCLGISRISQQYFVAQREYFSMLPRVVEMKIRTAKHIHAALVAQGLSCRSWALDNEYNPRTVQLYIKLFAPDTKRKPKSELACEILRKLSLTVGVNLCPGDAK